MKKKKWNKLVSVLLVMVTVMSLLSGCGGKSAEKEDAETITVYLWTTSLYEKYASYIQEQLPDINIEFVVGNNNLDFYRFLDENGGLPDIITCCRFSLHDASPLKDSLMDLSTTNAAGAVYDTYLNSFRNQDGSVNWLPVCADTHGFVVNKDLFEKYDIPLPTDYESFVSACQAFDEVGIRGFTADYYYDYTCMETLQGLSASELSSVDGRKWRTTYSDPDNTKREGLDSTVWPEAFERMEQFIQDTGLSQDDLDMNYDDVVEMYKSGKLAMYFGSSSGVKMFQDQGINTTFLPFFQQNGEKWLMTTPYFQIALNRDLTKDETRRQKAMKVLNTMLSEDAQNRIIYDGQDLLSYSQDVGLKLTEYLKDVKPVIEENHMYIRIASNDFFSISRDVVSKMISGEYNAEQAYQSFNTQLLEEKSTSEDIVLDSKKTYSNRFHTSGGNEAYSVMANTLRGIYGTDVLIATGNTRYNMGNSLMVGCAKMGMHFVACAPKKYWPVQELIDECQAIAKETGATLEFIEDPMVATKDANAIYTDVWVSMGEPDEVWEERINDLLPYRVTMDLINNADKDVVFMHCLPAFHDLDTKIGKQIYEKFGLTEMEVTDEVFESEHSVVFDEAENRMHTIKAVMAATLGAEF